jgi:hypothetical protein
MSGNPMYFAEDEHLIVCGDSCTSDGAFAKVFECIGFFLSSTADEPRPSKAIDSGKARFLMEW